MFEIDTNANASINAKMNKTKKMLLQKSYLDKYNF